MNKRKETYLGDGLYASYDGLQFTLRAPRLSEGDHYVCLDPSVLDAFLEFIEKTNGVKFSVKKVESVSDDEHKCVFSQDVDCDICPACGEHTGFCIDCGESECCGSGDYVVD